MLHKMANEARQMDEIIRKHAESRLDRVNSDIDRLSPRALLDDGDAMRYQEAIIERGRLHSIIA
jgi:hypothetical protein